MLCVRANESGLKKIKSAGETLVTRKSLLGFITAAAMALPALSTAQAQDYPNRPIRVLTTTSAGGLSDIFMRALGDELGKRMGTTFVIENRPGGTQNLGTRACSEAPPDGYTICIINADPLVYNQWLLKSMPFNPETALEPIINLYHLIHMLVVNADLRVKTIDDLVALSKSKPGTLNYLTPGAPMVLYMETLRKQRGADWVRVPFRGGGEAVNAILSGTTPIGLFGEGNVVGHIRSGAMLAAGDDEQRPLAEFPEGAAARRDRLRGRAVARLVRACSRRPVRRGRSSTASTRRCGRSSASRTSPPGISPRAAWCRRSTRRRSSPPRSCATARRPSRWCSTRE